MKDEALRKNQLNLIFFTDCLIWRPRLEKWIKSPKNVHIQDSL